MRQHRGTACRVDYLRDDALVSCPDIRSSTSKHPRLHAQHGQALVELAIFGSFLLLVLGSMVSLGLNADYRQQALMQAYRRAMWSAARSSSDNVPSSVSQTVMIDRIIPDPSHPFAIGTVASVSASAMSPLRTFEASKSADLDNTAELPHEVTTIQNRGQTVTVNCPSARRTPSGGPGCTTSGFRTVQIRGFDSNGKNIANVLANSRSDEIGAIELGAMSAKIRAPRFAEIKKRAQEAAAAKSAGAR